MKKLLLALMCILTIMCMLSACGDETTDSTLDSAVNSTVDSKNGTESSVPDSSVNSTVDSKNDTSDSNNTAGSKPSDVPGSGSTPDSVKPTDEAIKDKYNYDMSQYVTLPDYRAHLVMVELDSIQMAIDSYLMKYAGDYLIKRGDKVELIINAYDENGEKIEAICTNSLVIDRLCYKKNDAYQLSLFLEDYLVESKIGQKYSINVTLPDDFYNTEYRGQSVLLEMTVKGVACKLGDVVNVAYTGYLLDENDEILVENGEQKIFDLSTSANFFLGSYLAIEDFEKGIVGMSIKQTKDIYATFPSDYHASELAGKRVMFRVTLNGVYTPPMYDNSFVKTHFDYKTTGDYEESLKNDFILSKLYDFIYENAVIKSYPEKEYSEKLNALIANEEAIRQQYNMSLDEFLLEYYDMTREQYVKAEMKKELVYYAIAEKENDVKITNAMVENERKALLAYYKNYYIGKDYTEQEAVAKAEAIVSSLGYDYVYENAMYGMIDRVLIFYSYSEEVARTYISISEILQAQGELTYGTEVGNLLPSYSLEAFDGTGMLGVTYDPTQNLGKITVINFWGTWCTPCMKELPYFSEIAAKYKDSLNVYAIHSTQGFKNAQDYVDKNYSDSQMIFLKDIPSDPDVQYSPDMYYSMTGGASSYPYTVILDETGVIVYKHFGALTYEQLENLIVNLGVERVQ